MLRSYDHRLKALVRETGDVRIATSRGVPRSTAAGWLRQRRVVAVTLDDDDTPVEALQREVRVLRRRVRVLGAVVGLLLALLRAVGGRLDRRRLRDGATKARLLRAIKRARRVLALRPALHIVGLSSARYHAWTRAETRCALDDRPGCARNGPGRLTAAEVLCIKQMVEDPAYRHLPTSRLAVLAQRLGKVVASPTTWCRLVRERGWRRPRRRLYPAKPRTAPRASRPDERWHIDTTVIKLLDGTKTYLQAVIDNFSRRILAWRLADKLDVGNTVAVLLEAVRQAVPEQPPPTLVADAGVENVNEVVDAFLGRGVLRRVLALKDVSFSNSLVESWWRQLKGQWLYLHTLDSIEALRRLVAFYVSAHNSQIPHSAFRGQTPDEMYRGQGDDVPDKLAAAKRTARAARLEANRSSACHTCPHADAPSDPPQPAAA